MGCDKGSCRTRLTIYTHAPLQPKNRTRIKPVSGAYLDNLFSNWASSEELRGGTCSVANVYLSRRSSAQAENRRKLVGLAVRGRRLQKRLGNGIGQLFAFSS